MVASLDLIEDFLGVRRFSFFSPLLSIIFLIISYFFIYSFISFFISYPFERLDGGVSRAERQAAIDRFSDLENDHFVFLLSTRAGLLSIFSLLLFFFINFFF